MKIYSSNFIDGAWVPSSSELALSVTESATGQVIATVAESTAVDIDAAVKAARTAFDPWSSLPAVERAAWIQKIKDGLTARSDEIARAIAVEVGMPLKLASRVQVAGPVIAWGNYVQRASQERTPEQLGNSLVRRVPAGVVGCITPWNYPLHQITAKVAAALAAGCTVVLKPSEVAPTAAFILAEIIHAAGLPAGVLNMVSGTGPVVGEALAAHPDVDVISFTGSTAAGQRVAAVAAATTKRVALELGGKSASIVLDDAELARAVKSSVNDCFLNSGQTCSALTRLIVPATRYEEAANLAREVAAAMTLGDPLDPRSKLGPLVNAEQQERVRKRIDAARAAGAELVCGGSAQPAHLPVGYYVQPTIFGRVDPLSAIAQEEVFGPVLCIMTHQGDDDAVRIANQSLYGLAASVWAGEHKRALSVAERLRAGQVQVNGAAFNLNAPFGGFKQSGYGRENGAFGMDEFFELQSIQLPA